MAILIIVIILIVVLFFIQYNTIVKLRMKVKQSKSGIDVYCKQRFDLIPNLVSVVKAYQRYEEEMFTNIIKLRNSYYITKDIKVGEQIENQLTKIILVVENYPELKASERFLNLQKNLEKMESQLQAARRIYNNDVTKYNTKINIVPYNIIAKIFNFKEETLFEIEDPDERNNIKI